MGQPLDKPQAFFSGQFVQAAYNMFRRDPLQLKPEPQAGDIPEGWELGAWIHMSDFILNLKEPEFYGIVCRKADDADTRIIAIRGTEGAIEWIDDAAALPTPFRQVPDTGRVASGFDKIYSSLKVVKRKLAEDRALTAAAPDSPAAQETFGGSFAEQLDQLASSRELARGRRRSMAEARPPRPMVVTGHSLGSALATLFVMENASKHKFDINTSCTFASPRVGTLEFARAFDLLPINSWRIVNTLDVVPKLPPHIPVVLEYDHVDTGYPFKSSDFAKNSLVCWHAMETYLHWLDATYALRPECVP
ncbi:MAG: lipase family protein [Candidatus Sulfotelmatobacter sp.]